MIRFADAIAARAATCSALLGRMPPYLELLTSALDLVAFFLVTPIVIGEARIAAWYAQMGRAVFWVRTVWFNRDHGPLTLAALAPAVVIFGLLVLAALGLETPIRSAMLAQTGATLIPATFVVLYGIVSRLERRSTVFRALAILGAVLFVAGKLIAMGSAYSRL